MVEFLLVIYYLASLINGGEGGEGGGCIDHFNYFINVKVR